MELQLTNKNALVGGSTQGIGKATAIALANEGVNVTLIARNEDALKEVIPQLSGAGKHSYIVADFTKTGYVQVTEEIAHLFLLLLL